MEGAQVMIVGAGPVGSLAALYAAARGAEVYIYELRSGESVSFLSLLLIDLAQISLSWLSSESQGGSFLASTRRRFLGH